MFLAKEVNLNLTIFRVYDPGIGRWLSRDPLKNAEVEQGLNLFAYVQNDPVNRIDPLGLQYTASATKCEPSPPEDFIKCFLSCLNDVAGLSILMVSSTLFICGALALFGAIAAGSATFGLGTIPGGASTLAVCIGLIGGVTAGLTVACFSHCFHFLPPVVREPHLFTT